MKNLIAVFFAFFVASCSTIPSNSSSASGGLLVFPMDVTKKVGSGPWFNYNFHFRDVDTNEKHFVKAITKLNQNYYVSPRIPPGNYEMFRWEAISKNLRQVEERDILYQFTVAEGTISVFGALIEVKSDAKYQYTQIKPISFAKAKSVLEEIALDNPNIHDWYMIYGSDGSAIEIEEQH